MHVACRASVAVIVFLAIPFVAHAAGSSLVWGIELDDPDQIIMTDGGTFAVPLDVSRDVMVDTTGPFFEAEGVLFRVPNPEESGRDFVAHLGGFFGDGALAWQETGIYELDVYWVDFPQPVQAPLLQRLFVYLFALTAHAQSADHFIETIRFTIVEEGAVEECCSSVVFLPGIKGSVLKTGSDTLWPPTIWSDDVPQLALDDETGESVNDVYVDGILNTFYSTPIYSPFGDFLDGLVAEGLINAWEPFAYDWRFSPEKILDDGVNTSSGVVDLVEKIEALAASSQTGQVTIVAHSMGGYMGKALIKKLEEEGKDGLVDAFVMVGTPQLGTPQAVAAILHGDDEGIVAGLVVRPSDARAIAQNMPSAYDLLPSPRYFDDVSDPVITFDPEASFTDEWRDFWGPFIDTYADFFSFATGNGVPRDEPLEGLLRVPEVLRADLMTSASDFHGEFDDHQFPEHIRVVQVAGWGRPTAKVVEYVENHSFPSYRTLLTREGDKTVVYPSAISSVADETYFFNIFDYNELFETNAQHRDLLNIDLLQNLVESVIEESEIAETGFISSTKPLSADLADQLVVSTHSPVILGVYDESRNFTGINPEQDLSEEVLFITENIPGSSFLYSSESQHIFLPKNGTYNFVYKGIGDGLTTLELEEFTNDITTPIASYTDIPTMPGTLATSTVKSAAPEETIVEVDVDGDGDVDALFAPDEATPPIVALLALLKEKIEGSDINNKLKKELLKKIAKLEKKLKKNKLRKKAKALTNLEKKIVKKNEKGKVTDSDAQELLNLLEQLENAI